MAKVSNTFVEFDAVGNREDLSDMIYDVSPYETPVLSAIKKKKAKAVLHEWQQDTLAAAAANAQVEGDDALNSGMTNNAITPTTRLSNYTQILRKVNQVSGTQDTGVDKAGRSKEMAYQMARRMKEIKTDLEWAILNGGAAIGNAKVADGDGATAREMGSLQTYLTTNVSVGATGAASAGNGAVMTGGTDRDLTEALLTAVLADCFTNGADPKLLVCSATNKGVVSTFTGGGTRYVDTDDKKLVNSIDVYVGDFHTLKVVPSRQTIGDNVYLIDPEYLAVADLRPLHSKDLATTGDNTKKALIWETTLEVCSQKAHGLIADTNG